MHSLSHSSRWFDHFLSITLLILQVVICQSVSTANVNKYPLIVSEPPPYFQPVSYRASPCNSDNECQFQSYCNNLVGDGSSVCTHCWRCCLLPQIYGICPERCSCIPGKICGTDWDCGGIGLFCAEDPAFYTPVCKHCSLCEDGVMSVDGSCAHICSGGTLHNFTEAQLTQLYQSTSQTVLYLGFVATEIAGQGASSVTQSEYTQWLEGQGSSSDQASLATVALMGGSASSGLVNVSDWIAAYADVASDSLSCPVFKPEQPLAKVVFEGCPCNFTSAPATFRCEAGFRCSRDAYTGTSADLLEDPTAVLLKAVCVTCPPGLYCPEGTVALNESDLYSLECGAGFYCPNATMQHRCPSGSYCVQNSAEPQSCDLNSLLWSNPDLLLPAQPQSVIVHLRNNLDPQRGNICPSNSTASNTACPGGYYCPNVSSQVQCPQGYFCKQQSIAPRKCPSLTHCPAGTMSPNFSGLALLALLMMLCILPLVWIGITKLDAQITLQDLAQAPKQSSRDLKMGRQLLGRSFKLTQSSSLAARYQGLQLITPHISLVFESLGLKVMTPLSKEETIVLSGVSGYFAPCQMHAIMGPSGCGKTTFLSVLSGRAKGQVTGHVVVNGEVIMLSQLAKVKGYVPQDDIVHEDLTVKENLIFSAHIKVHEGITAARKRKIVIDALDMLDIRSVKNSRVGSVERRGISGGQRKRVSIGMEMVGMPSVLLLDEPTSGLDATTGADILMCLSDMAELGMTVIAVIHAPRFSSFLLFDSVLLLGQGGQSVYVGPPAVAVLYFQRALRFMLPPRENPADILMDIIAGRVPRADVGNVSPHSLAQWWKDHGLAWVVQFQERNPLFLGNLTLDRNAVTTLTEIFKSVDYGKKGRVGAEQVREVFQRVGVNVCLEDCNVILRNLVEQRGSVQSEGNAEDNGPEEAADLSVTLDEVLQLLHNLVEDQEHIMDDPDFIKAIIIPELNLETDKKEQCQVPDVGLQPQFSRNHAINKSTVMGARLTAVLVDENASTAVPPPSVLSPTRWAGASPTRYFSPRIIKGYQAAGNSPSRMSPTRAQMKQELPERPIISPWSPVLPKAGNRHLSVSRFAALPLAAKVPRSALPHISADQLYELGTKTSTGNDGPLLQILPGSVGEDLAQLTLDGHLSARQQAIGEGLEYLSPHPGLNIPGYMRDSPRTAGVLEPFEISDHDLPEPLVAATALTFAEGEGGRFRMPASTAGALPYRSSKISPGVPEATSVCEGTEDKAGSFRMPSTSVRRLISSDGGFANVGVLDPSANVYGSTGLADFKSAVSPFATNSHNPGNETHGPLVAHTDESSGTNVESAKHGGPVLSTGMPTGRNVKYGTLIESGAAVPSAEAGKAKIIIPTLSASVPRGKTDRYGILDGSGVTPVDPEVADSKSGVSPLSSKSDRYGLLTGSTVTPSGFELSDEKYGSGSSTTSAQQPIQETRDGKFEMIFSLASAFKSSMGSGEHNTMQTSTAIATKSSELEAVSSAALTVTASQILPTVLSYVTGSSDHQHAILDRAERRYEPDAQRLIDAGHRRSVTEDGASPEHVPPLPLAPIRTSRQRRSSQESHMLMQYRHHTRDPSVTFQIAGPDQPQPHVHPTSTMARYEIPRSCFATMEVQSMQEITISRNDLLHEQAAAELPFMDSSFSSAVTPTCMISGPLKPNVRLGSMGATTERQPRELIGSQSEPALQNLGRAHQMMEGVSSEDAVADGGLEYEDIESEAEMAARHKSIAVLGMVLKGLQKSIADASAAALAGPLVLSSLEQQAGNTPKGAQKRDELPALSKRSMEGLSRRSVIRMEISTRRFPGFWRQLPHILARTALQFSRSFWPTRVIDTLLLLAAAFIIGGIEGTNWQVTSFPDNAAMAMVCLSVLTTVTFLRTFSTSQLIYAREADGRMSSGAYFLAHNLVDCLWMFPAPAVFLGAYYYMTLPNMPLGNYYLVALAVTWWSSGIAYLVTALLPPPSILVTGVFASLILGAFLNGLSPSIAASRGTIMEFILGCSYNRWAMEMLSLYEMVYYQDNMMNVLIIMADQVGLCGVDKQLVSTGNGSGTLTPEEAVSFLELSQYFSFSSCGIYHMKGYLVMFLVGLLFRILAFVILARKRW